MRQISRMKQFACSFALFFVAATLHSQSTHELTLKRTIMLEGVTGKFDHFALDRSSNRLFASAAGSHAVEVLDLTSGKIVDTLPGIAKPHGLAWIADNRRLFVADGAKGELVVYAGSPLRRLATIPLSEDADDMVYDEQTKLLYVGHGGTDAANPARVAVVETETLKLIAELPVAKHPEALELDAKQDRILVNLADAGKIAVIDGKTHQIRTTWALGQNKGNTPLAYDAAQNLVLVGCRTPARLLVLDGKDGKEMEQATSDAGADDLFFDPTTRRAYLIAGSGAVDVFSVGPHGQVTPLPITHTVPGAKTGYLDEQGDSLFLGIPGIAGDAAVRVYDTGRSEREH